MATLPSLTEVKPYEPPEFDTSIGSFGAIDIPPAPEYAAPETYKPAYEETTAGQMEGILASGSPYVEAARKSGERTAQQRGLLNSGLAAESGQKAAIESAFPIASQDAATYAASGLKGQEGEIAGALESQRYTGGAQTIGLQAEASDVLASRASEREGKFAEYNAAVQAGLSKQDAAQKAGLSIQEAEQRLEFDKQQQVYADIRQQAEITANQTLQTAQLGSEEKQSYGGQVNLLGSDFQSQVDRIQADPNIPPESKTSIINSLQSSYESTMVNLAQIYGVDITFSGTGTTAGTGTPEGKVLDQGLSDPGQSPPPGWTMAQYKQLQKNLATPSPIPEMNMAEYNKFIREFKGF